MVKLSKMILEIVFIHFHCHTSTLKTPNNPITQKLFYGVTASFGETMRTMTCSKVVSVLMEEITQKS